MAQIKGFAIRGLLKYVKESGHPGGIAEVVAALPGDVRPVFDRKIDHSGWYPYRAYAELLATTDRLLGRGDLSLSGDLGRFAARSDAGGVFKFVAFFTSVETLLRRSTLFWARYCDTGVFETVDVQKNAGTGVLRDFPGVAPAHCHLLTGWIAEMTLQCGARASHVDKTRCVHRGDTHCEYSGTWES